MLETFGIIDLVETVDLLTVVLFATVGIDGDALANIGMLATVMLTVLLLETVGINCCLFTTVGNCWN